MNKLFRLNILTYLLCGLFAISSFAQKADSLKIEPGVSYVLAQYRQGHVSNINYKLDFSIPADKNQLIDATEELSFTLKNHTLPLQIDFKQPAERVQWVKVNGNAASVNLVNEHLVIGSRLLRDGINKISIRFKTGDQSLNRNDDYLYELNVPDHARTVFPCFDQPDLKARFTLTLRIPAAWKALANGALIDTIIIGDQKICHFKTSDLLSTYLFSFAAGKFSQAKQQIGQHEAEFLYRETDPKKISLSVDSVFKAHRDAISFLEQWTGIPFPFQKIGFVGIPDFQFGGMEHPGEVQYQSSSLFLDEGATKDRFIARGNLISHETAHMWFGDLVTMKWFNDVWMKEVFANFMADKVTEKVMGRETFGLKFLQDHYPAAYGIDRTEGANPIRQQLNNLQEAGTMYGNIIYHKAPVMMRQLEMLMGKAPFRAGMREYLKKYSYGNATWPDLISILSKHTKADLYQWNKVWVNEPGRPVFDYKVKYDGTDQKISRLTLTQHSENGADRLWPQFFNVALVYVDHTIELPVNMNAHEVTLATNGNLAKPQLIVFNSNGIGYGVFPVDQSLNTEKLFALKSPLQRASVYISAYENMLSARYFKPQALLNLLASGLKTEKEETNLRLLTGYISTIYWEFISKEARNNLTERLETMLWDAMQQQTAANNKKILFGAYQNVYLSAQAKSNIYRIWKTQQAPDGVKLTEDDYTSLALSIALKSDTVTSVLQQQDDRIKNTDRKKRLEFMMPSLSLNVQERDNFFNSLADRKNRAKEAWVAAALGYLHHPLRQQTSEKYLPKSLELLEEIQKTGDIFFPQNWLGAIFSNYQDQQAAEFVRRFLADHPNYNPKLKAKILQSTDNLFRATKLVQ